MLVYQRVIDSVTRSFLNGSGSIRNSPVQPGGPSGGDEAGEPGIFPRADQSGIHLANECN